MACPVEQDTKLAKTVKHVAIEVSFRHRAAALEDIITYYGKGSHAIVFTQTKRECDELASGGVFKTLTSQVICVTHRWFVISLVTVVANLQPFSPHCFFVRFLHQALISVRFVAGETYRQVM